MKNSRILLALTGLATSLSVFASSETGSVTGVLQVPFSMSYKLYIAFSAIYFLICLAGSGLEWRAFRLNAKHTPIYLPLFFLLIGLIAIILPFTFPLSNHILWGSGISCVSGWTGSVTCFNPERPELKLIAIAIGLFPSLVFLILALIRLNAHKKVPEKNSMRISYVLLMLGALSLILPYAVIWAFQIGA